MTKYYYTYHHLLYFLLAFSLASTTVLGQTETDDYLYIPIEEKTFEDKQWEDIHKELDYSGEAPESEKEEETTIPELPDFSFPNISGFVKVIGFALIIGLIGFIMYHIINQTNISINNDNIGDFSTNNGTPLSLDELELQLDKQDVNPYILKAEEEKNYTLAVRLHFLALLKKLNENNDIRWRKNHTNNTYLNQMRGKNNFTHFLELTKKYEDVWYGDRHPNLSEYENICSDFNDFKVTDKPSTV